MDTGNSSVVLVTKDWQRGLGRIPMLIAELSLSSLTVSGQQNAVPMLSAD